MDKAFDDVTGLEIPPGKDRLQLQVQPGAIKHLGIKLYHRPADVVSELVANAWDADSSIASITINQNEGTIKVYDDGDGMTYSEVQDLYLQMGRDRRAATGETHTSLGRPILGRKGIGKFSGLGIARTIRVDTVSKKTRERTVFEISPDFEVTTKNGLEDLVSTQRWYEPDESRHPGTTITLMGIEHSLDDRMIERFRTSLSRRFLLSENVTNMPFAISVNGNEIAEPYSEEKQFDFPKDLSEGEKAELHVERIDENGWAITTFKSHDVSWRIGYSRKPIKDEELRGVAIFAHGKLAQSAFFFDQRGGSSADLAKEYITGQIKMDFVDEELDLISPERQRLQFESQIGEEIKEWGLGLLSKLNNIWKKRRAEQKVSLVIEDPLNSGVKDRIDSLSSSEQRTIRGALEKIAKGSSKLDDDVFKNIASDLVTAYEKGRLKKLIDDIDRLDDPGDSQQILELISETGILADLQIGEAIKIKIEAIAELKDMITREVKENTVRDFIAEHPWIIHPKFETYKRETSLHKIISDFSSNPFVDTEEVYNGRIDLMLANTQRSDFLLLEFMRPGKRLDEGHIDRIKKYVFDIRQHLKYATTHEKHAGELSEAWLVAEYNTAPYVEELLEECRNKKIYFFSWETFLQNGLSAHVDSLSILKDRNNDPRIAAL